MLTFINEEPTFRWPRNTSVLDDWNEKRKWLTSIFGFLCSFSTGVFANSEREDKENRIKSPLEEPMPTSEWPFNWDWNELFCHDFQFLTLPATVLLDVMKKLNRAERRAMYLTSSRLRNLMLRNKSKEMDRKETVGSYTISISSFEIIFVGGDVRATFDNLPSFERFLKVNGEKKVLEQVSLLTDTDTVSNVPFELSNMIDTLVEMAESVNLLAPWEPSDQMVEEMLNAFMTCTQVVEMYMDVKDTVEHQQRWNRAHATVTQWAQSNGMEVIQLTRSIDIGSYDDWGFKKSIWEGKKVLIVRVL